ncbi:MAG: myo-inosose-2 dehydratase [Bosea sp.]|jgi:inosose dehydratase|nr:myo-inosose-2 dehydratase [Bosea sp. (in: a-proteobacteria)]
MAIRIGANPIGWSNDDLQEVGGDTPLETCLAEAREAGFEGMELGHKFPREASALKAALAPFGMACVGGWHSVELLRRDAATEFALAAPHRALLRAMGADVFIVAETSNAIHGDRTTPLSRRPRLAPGEWSGFCARMTELADRLAEEGLRLCYHHHMGTIVQSRDDIAAFMDGCGPAVNLLLDTGHATWGGSDPAELARSYRPRISHFHAKDVREPIMAKARAGDWSFLDAILGKGDEHGVYTVPGDGMVDYVAVFRELAGYDGWVIVEAEQDPLKAHPLTYARKGVASLKRFLAQSGLST